MNDTKMSANKEKKAKLIAEMSEKVGRSKALVFTDYQGLTHKQIEEFKKGLRKLEAEYAVTKNTLMKRALTEQKYNIEGQEMDQATGTLFLYGDPVGPLKALSKMIKELQKPGIKFGILDKQLLTEKQVMQFATLPSREVLLAQLMSMMQSPVAGLHRSLNWNLQKFVMTLKAIETKKTNGEKVFM